MKKILPVLLILLGIGGGAGAGLFLRPSAEDEPACAEEPCETAALEVEPVEDAPTDTDFVKLSRQFVVPVVGSERVHALVVVTLSVEVNAGLEDMVYAREPKLRDAFLQVMLHHANTGGFDGQFTAGPAMADLRGKLLEAAVKIIGEDALAILVTDIARQDVQG